MQEAAATVELDDANLREALIQFKRAFETRAADADWHPSEEGVRQELAAGLRSHLDLPPRSIEFDYPSGANRLDLWVTPMRLAVELKFHRPIRSGYNRPMTQQYGALLADCNKLASVDAADRLLVLVTDRAGTTHVANKKLLPIQQEAGPRLLETMDIEHLAPTARGIVQFTGPWISMSVDLIWRASRDPWSFFAWRILKKLTG
jgi:hypothetical protein